MTDAEQTKEELKLQFLERAATAVGNAYGATLKAGLSVLVVQDDILYRVTPDGEKHALRPVAKSIAVEKGRIIKFQWVARLQA